METNVSLRILLYLDVFWAFPRPVACLGRVQLIADNWTFLEVQIHYARQTQNS